MKLIPMTDFVLELNKQLKNAPDAYDQYCSIVGYAKFLKQPLKLEMFVPCDPDGNPFEKIGYSGSEEMLYSIQEAKYKEAKEKVLFKGFSFNGNGHFTDENGNFISQYEKGKFKILIEISQTNCTLTPVKTIENLVGLNIELTENAIKQSNL